ncbi:flagellar biosynthesis protein FlhF [Evansella caseinilytica]|uniref:Flagellar biosynthesis protein FlhF n=1 Tax=Evansella caseinilytica TaxID=1503961 RepID=A0A1H3M612_9BACI|nr:flagellar biosynthesis protein FlhF [Evansella caseinilytica]SDY71445.1 flagellar biosynthesis protein FlhF [Evansella caseinilytica]
MKVKKFIAKNMPEAMVKVREELGNDAVILHSKPIETGGFLGFFTKKNVEIIAAIDPDLRKKAPQKRKDTKAGEPLQRAGSLPKELTGEIAELKKLMQGFQKQPAADRTTTNYPGHLTGIHQRLLDQEVSEANRHIIMDHLLKRWYSENGEEQSQETVTKWTVEACQELMDKENYGPFLYEKRFLNVVGPTGVGKTTTIAKIAANAVLRDKKKAAFITTDTYRIAAIEQLKTYANILNVPVEVAYSIDDFKAAKEKLKEYDVIFVDSAGRNFRNPVYVEQLGDVIDFNDEMETHLVLSLTSKYSDMKNIVDQFKSVNVDKVIFTKADETTSYGAMLNVYTDFKIGASYITMGQNVPDDIVEASPGKVTDRLLRS